MYHTIRCTVQRGVRVVATPAGRLVEGAVDIVHELAHLDGVVSMLRTDNALGLLGKTMSEANPLGFHQAATMTSHESRVTHDFTTMLERQAR